ncbi:MAG: hypothetical protein M3277_07145 [Actinomycetota bacterium]|nr:hypothetical protein [Actinomycetota bacterium]
MRTIRRGIAPVALLLLMTTLPSPVSAGSGLTQAASVTARLNTPYQVVELCLNEECESILLPGTSRGLTLDLSYTLTSAGHLPNVLTEVGTPTACELKNPDGTITKRVGAAVFASGATFSERSSVHLSDGGKPVKHKTTQPGKPTKTDSVGASVCVTT